MFSVDRKQTIVDFSIHFSLWLSPILCPRMRDLSLLGRFGSFAEPSLFFQIRVLVLFSEPPNSEEGKALSAPFSPLNPPSNDGSVSTQCWHAWRLLVVEFCANLHHHRYMLAKERNTKERTVGFLTKTKNSHNILILHKDWFFTDMI